MTCSGSWYDGAYGYASGNIHLDKVTFSHFFVYEKYKYIDEN